MAADSRVLHRGSEAALRMAARAARLLGRGRPSAYSAPSATSPQTGRNSFGVFAGAFVGDVPAMPSTRSHCHSWRFKEAAARAKEYAISRLARGPGRPEFSWSRERSAWRWAREASSIPNAGKDFIIRASLEAASRQRPRWTHRATNRSVGSPHRFEQLQESMM